MKLNDGEDAIHVTTTAQKWGNSIGIRIPKKIAQKYGVDNGSEILVTESKEGILLKPVEAEATLEELLAQITDENRHEEYFNKPMGKELL